MVPAKKQKKKPKQTKKQKKNKKKGKWEMSLKKGWYVVSRRKGQRRKLKSQVNGQKVLRLQNPRTLSDVNRQTYKHKDCTDIQEFHKKKKKSKHRVLETW